MENKRSKKLILGLLALAGLAGGAGLGYRLYNVDTNTAAHSELERKVSDSKDTPQVTYTNNSKEDANQTSTNKNKRNQKREGNLIKYLESFFTNGNYLGGPSI